VPHFLLTLVRSLVNARLLRFGRLDSCWTGKGWSRSLVGEWPRLVVVPRARNEWIRSCYVTGHGFVPTERQSHTFNTRHTLAEILHQRQGRKLLKLNWTPWPESASELYRPTDCHLLTKLVPIFADIGCHVVSVTGPYGRILGFLDWRRYFFFQAAHQLYSLGWVDLVPDPLLLRKYSRAGNRKQTSGSVATNSDH
jgi:hypothetical protein